MIVPSFAFLAFGAVTAAVLAVAGSASRRRVFLVANAAFLATFTLDPRQFVPFASLLAIGFIALKIAERFRRGWALVVLLVTLLATFFWLKQYVFVPSALFLHYPYFVVGMSYVFFRQLHLVIDTQQGALQRRIGLVSYLSYTMNFTCLIAGPIQLYEDYVRTETDAPAALTRTDVLAACGRIATGFFKVAVVAAGLQLVHEGLIRRLVPGLPGDLRIAYGALALVDFPIYLYFNFSGYTDFVIGVARFMRLELPENFNRPFAAESVIDFWARWHMTLSGWLRTYVYSPFLLATMRRFPDPRVVAALGVVAYFVTFFLVGAWHGQSAKFLFFGLLTGLGISLNKLYEVLVVGRIGRATYARLRARPLYAAGARALNFVWFCFTMLWFWSTLDQLGAFWTALGPACIFGAILAALIGSAILLTAYVRIDEAVRAFAKSRGAGAFYGRVAWYAAIIVLTLSATVVLNAPAQHIVYRAF